MTLDVIPTFSRPARHMLLTLQRAFAAVPSASAMPKLLLSLVALAAGVGLVRGAIKTPENAPIEITSTGQTTYEGGLATARDNVAIHVGDTDIYAEYVQYTANTHEAELIGNVRSYRAVSFCTDESGRCNIDTKPIRRTHGK